MVKFSACFNGFSELSGLGNSENHRIEIYAFIGHTCKGCKVACLTSFKSHQCQSDQGLTVR